MIEVEGLTKYYGHVTAIKDVSFSVEKGEILGFLGPNAAGKTTTMRILTCFMPPSTGSARVAGHDIFTESLAVRKRVGYMPESVPLYPDLTVLEYLNFVGEIKKIPKPDRKTAMAKTVGECGLTQVQNRLIKNLSKGFKQRVGLAQALLNDPEVLILDEPTVGLDPKQIIEIRNLIKRLGGDRTIILSTHILPEVSMVCGRVIIINDGKVVVVDTPENLTRQLQKSALIKLQVEGPREDVGNCLRSLQGVTNVDIQKSELEDVYSFVLSTDQDRDIRKIVSSEIVKNGWGLLELRSVGMSLEDIFIKLVTEEEEV